MCVRRYWRLSLTTVRSHSSFRNMRSQFRRDSSLPFSFLTLQSYIQLVTNSSMQEIKKIYVNCVVPCSREVYSVRSGTAMVNLSYPILSNKGSISVEPFPLSLKPCQIFSRKKVHILYLQFKFLERRWLCQGCVMFQI
jgi:hypothetical protein